MRELFDPVVQMVLDLVRSQAEKVKAEARKSINVSFETAQKPMH
jgi:hypothetical protein